MRLVASVSVIVTIMLVYASHCDAVTQWWGVTLATALGALVAFYVMRSARFDALSVRSILTLAIALRVLALFALPLLEDDHFRYLWDGYRFAVSGTPYGAAPSAFFADASVPRTFQTILNFINYPDIPTIYGPVMQLLFVAAYALAPGNVGALQGLNALIDLLVLWILARTGAKPRWLLLYAISPLVLKEAVMTAHPDGLTGLLALAALVWARRPWVTGSLLGLAVASKISSVILIPFLFWRGGWRAGLAALASVVACYLPFMLLPGSDMTALMQFARNWRFNPLLFAAIEQLVGAHFARLVAAILSVTILLWVYWRDLRAPRRSIAAVDHALGVLLVLSPVVNPWYLLWLLPFAVLRPSRTAWAATFVLPLSYWNGTQTGGHQFDLPTLITTMEIVVLLAAAMLDARQPLCSKSSAPMRTP